MLVTFGKKFFLDSIRFPRLGAETSRVRKSEKNNIESSIEYE